MTNLDVRKRLLELVDDDFERLLDDLPAVLRADVRGARFDAWPTEPERPSAAHHPDVAVIRARRHAQVEHLLVGLVAFPKTFDRVEQFVR